MNCTSFQLDFSDDVKESVQIIPTVNDDGPLCLGIRFEQSGDGNDKVAQDLSKQIVLFRLIKLRWLCSGGVRDIVK